MSRARVVDTCRAHVVVETGEDPGPGWAPRRAAVVAHWDSQPRVSRSLHALVGELACQGWSPVVVSTASGAESLRWPHEVPPGTLVIRRPNVGYDFGSWAVALDRYPGLMRAEHLALANDSLLGPFASLDSIFVRMEAAPCDVWGMTSTTQFLPHLQSYFLVFRRGVMADPPLRRFWREVRIEPSKQEVIRRGELGLSHLLRDEAYSTSAAFPSATVVPAGLNPTIRGWHSLLDLGFPFVKRELVTNPAVAADAPFVPAVVEAMFSTDVEDWM